MTNCYLNVLDIGMVYWLCLYLTRCPKVIKKKWVIIAIAFGIVMGIIGDVMTETTDNPILFDFVYNIAIFIMVKLVTHKKDIRSIANCFFLNFIIAMVVQIFFAIILSLFLLEYEYLLAFIGQTLAYLFIRIICKKMYLHKLYYFIEREIFAQFIIYGGAVCFFAYIIYLEDDGTKVLSSILNFALLGLIVAICLIKTIKRIIISTHKFPMLYHELNNTMFCVYTSACIANDFHELQNKIKEYCNYSDYVKNIDNMKKVNHETIIKRLIEQKKLESNKEVSFESEVKYISDNQLISFEIMVHILATFIDNAIEASKSPELPIIVKLSVSKLHALLAVENEFHYEQNKQNELDIFFENSYTTKKDNSNAHGYGLARVKQILDNYGIDIQIGSGINKKYGQLYLSLKVLI
jgi:sensor histidine kinase regulating citrate/malate metabolism